MKSLQNDELLRARIADAIDKCARGSLATLGFLTPHERHEAEKILRAAGESGAAFFHGGYDLAERTCLFLLPEYLTSFLSAPLPNTPTDEVLTLLGESATDAVFPIFIKGSGFRKLSHRDYLGALLALGIERDALGDIALQNDYAAVVFTSRKIGAYLLETLERIGQDGVQCGEYRMNETFTDGRHYEPLSRTVASLRLDCVVAALTDLSRDAAQKTIKEGMVEVDFEPEERIDLLIEPPATISVRGFGRYVLRSIDGKTRRDRLRLSADRLV